MHIEKVQQNTSLLNNLNRGDLMIFSRSAYADEIQITPQNIYWVDYSNQQGVSLRCFDKGEKFILYPELKAGNYWYLLRLTLYLK